jgi:hypothetical protein
MAGEVVTAAADRTALRERLLRVLGGVPATPAPAQSQMLAAAAAKDGLSPHVDLVSARITGPVDVAALRAALDALVVRHETLRTHFVLSERPLMVVRPPERARLVAEPVAGLAEAAARAAALMATPADVTAAAPHQALLLSLDERTHVLLAPLPHLVSDEGSHAVYLRDLAALYTGAALPPPGRYRDHAEALAAALADGAAVARRAAALAPPLPAMTWPRTPERRRYRQLTVAGTWERAWLTDVTRRLATRGVTFGIACAAAYVAALHAVTGAEDVRVGTSMANRGPAHTGTIGLFATMSVLRVPCTGGDTVGEVLDRTRASMLGAIDDAHVPLAPVLGALRAAEPGFRSSSLYEATLAVVNQGTPISAGPATTIEPVDGFDLDDRPKPAFVPAHLAVRRGTADRDTEVRFGYNSDLLTGDDATGVPATMARYLRAVADDPGRPLATVSAAVRDG